MSVRALLDEALIGLRSIEDAEIPVQEARSYVAASLARVYDALAHVTEHGVYRESTTAALQLARDALTVLSFKPSVDPGVFYDLRLVAQAIGLLAQSVPPPESAPRLPRGEKRPALRASVGVPTLHDLERTVLHPTIPLPELETIPPPRVDPEASSVMPPPEVRSAEDLAKLEEWGRRAAEAAAVEEEEEAPPPSPPPLPKAGDAAAIEAVFGKASPPPHVLWTRGRQWFEDIAMMSLMRRLGQGELWSNLEPVETRLLARVDAILACGSWILPRLVQLLEERPLLDPELLWASIFVLGSIYGDDTRDQIERLVRVAQLDDPSAFESAADALTFAPHRGVEGLARRWMEEGHTRRSLLGIRVLGRRRATTVETLAPHLATEDPERLSETIAALELVPGDVRSAYLSRALGHADARVFRTTVECAIARGLESGAREARARLSTPDASAAAPIAAIASDEHAFELLLGAAATAPSRELYDALGWYGHVGAVPFLLGRLAAGDEAAVVGLQRITGASIDDESKEPPEYEDGELPFVREHFVAPTFVAKLSADAERWSAWWRRYGGRADPRVRYRWGHRWSTRDDYYELAEGIATAEQRRLAYLELCARAGGALPFDGREFVPRQRAQLHAWREYLGERHERAPRGSWRVRFRS